jgi:hypothetical protein
MSEEDLERYETEMELQLYKEYRDVLPLFGYVVETERRFYLANTVDMQLHDDDGRDHGGRSHLELELKDAWVWDIYRPGPARFVSSVRIVTFKDVNIEKIRNDP